MFFYWRMFGDGIDPDETRDITFEIVAGLVITVGTFLILYFLKQFFTNPVIIHLTDEGLEYIPAGVSTKFIKWSEIREIKEVNVRVVRGNVPALETALGLTLKDPEGYRQQFNAALAGLMKLNEKMYGATVLIQPSSFGKKYPEVKKIITQMTGLKLASAATTL